MPRQFEKLSTSRRSAQVVHFLSLFLLAAIPACAQTAISLQMDNGAAIANSQRSYYANITGTSNQGVNWTVKGGCSLSSSTGTPVVVTAPAKGASCTASTTNTISFSSAVSCTITATAQDTSNGIQSTSTVLPVCAPTVNLTTFPQTTVIYQKQYAVIQSDLRGSTNTDVTWSITTNPGAAGVLLGGNTNRHAVFTSIAPGTYVLTATSVADSTKTSATTIYVTGNAMPGTIQADHTEPVDCTAVGSGTTYEVGPSRAYVNLDVVPWNSLNPGDTVRIHNDDVTGQNPTVYNQHVSILASGTATEPIRICGVPDAFGNKPIIDGSKATSPAQVDWASGVLEPLGVMVFYKGSTKSDTTLDSNQNVILEGLHIRNVGPAYNYISQSGANSEPYQAAAACVYVATGRGILIRGNELENCSQAVFTNSQTPTGNIIYDLTVEGNYITNWGLANDEIVHGMYLQAIGLTAQFNYFDTSAAQATGNVIKSRSVLNFLRWNYITQPVTTTARAFDLVEPQAFNCYIIPGDYAIYLQPSQSSCNTPGGGGSADTMTADNVAANYEAYHSDYVYGNVMDDTGSNSGYVHYGYDQQTSYGPALNRRGGTLYYWNNTQVSRNSYKLITETATPDQGHSYEFPMIKSINNVFAGSSSTSFTPTVSFWEQMDINSNWMPSGYGLPYVSNTDQYMGGTSAADQATCNQYGKCSGDQGHLTWSRNNVTSNASTALYTGTTSPVDSNTYLPTASLDGIAATLPAPIADQPANMEFFPATSAIAVKADSTYLGALDNTISTHGPIPTEAVTLTISPASSVTITEGQTLNIASLLLASGSTPTGKLVYHFDSVRSEQDVSQNGKNVVVYSDLKAGKHVIRAKYLGNNVYPAVHAPDLIITVVKAGSGTGKKADTGQ
jgi:hypothetical protein